MRPPIFFGAATVLPLTVASLQGAHLLQVHLWDGVSQYPKPFEVWANTVPATSSRHLSSLHWLQRTIAVNPALYSAPLATAVLRALDLKSKAARCPWLPQTHFRELTQLDGALGSLGKYTLNTETRLRMSESVTWSAAKTAWERLAIQHQPVHQAAATATDIALAISRASDPQVRMFIMLLWLSCARKGDVAKLRQESVSLLPNGRLRLFIQEGKGVLAKRAKYHVISHVPEPWLPELQSFLAQPRAARTPLFRPSLGLSNEVTVALRLANDNLNCRSVRRGALQTMALSGLVDEPTLMRMSGHRNVETMRRYLDWDATNEQAHARAQDAARAGVFHEGCA